MPAVGLWHGHTGEEGLVFFIHQGRIIWIKSGIKDFNIDTKDFLKSMKIENGYFKL